MASPAFVQNQFTSGAGPSGATITVTLTVTAGNFLAIGVGWFANGDTTITISCSANNGDTVTPVYNATYEGGANNCGGAMYYVKGANGGSTTITVTPSAALNDFFVSVSEFSGVSKTSPLDGNQLGTGNSSSSTVATTANINTTIATDTIYALLNFADQNQVSPGSGFTSTGASDSFSADGYKQVSVTGAYQGSWNISVSPTANWLIMAMALAPAVVIFNPAPMASAEW